MGKKVADDDGNKQWSMLSPVRSGFTRRLEKQMPLRPPFPVDSSAKFGRHGLKRRHCRLSQPRLKVVKPRASRTSGDNLTTGVRMEDGWS